MARLEGWSVRQLNERMKSMLFERTAISKKPELTIQNDLAKLRNDGRISADLAFRDPYVLDFLGLADTFSERDLESSILVELQRFIIELGTDFAFVVRQKRITIDNRDYYIDLLFFHRRLRRMVVIDLHIEAIILRRFLSESQGYRDALITKALYELNKVAGDQAKSLYEVNKEVYRLLRYGVKVREGAGENKKTVWLINWDEPEKNDFGLAGEVTAVTQDFPHATGRPFQPTI